MTTSRPDQLLPQLLQAILHHGHAALTSEQAACDFIAGLRWPNGEEVPCETCIAPLVRRDAHLTCANGHRSTIFRGTPLGSLRKPRALAILLGIRAIATSKRGVSARELARVVQMPANTLWRHLLRLRTMLRRPPIIVLPTAAAVQVGAGYAAVAAPAAMHAQDRASPLAGRRVRLVGESVRTWLNGTFHGVSVRFLHRYLQEAAARFCYDASYVAEGMCAPLLCGGDALWFEAHVRRRERQPTFATMPAT